jgi:hypothetical protein
MASVAIPKGKRRLGVKWQLIGGPEFDEQARTGPVIDTNTCTFFLLLTSGFLCPEA